MFLASTRNLDTSTSGMRASTSLRSTTSWYVLYVICFTFLDYDGWNHKVEIGTALLPILEAEVEGQKQHEGDLFRLRVELSERPICGSSSHST